MIAHGPPSTPTQLNVHSGLPASAISSRAWHLQTIRTPPSHRQRQPRHPHATLLHHPSHAISSVTTQPTLPIVPRRSRSCPSSRSTTSSSGTRRAAAALLQEGVGTVPLLAMRVPRGKTNSQSRGTASSLESTLSSISPSTRPGSMGCAGGSRKRCWKGGERWVSLIGWLMGGLTEHSRALLVSVVSSHNVC